MKRPGRLFQNTYNKFTCWNASRIFLRGDEHLKVNIRLIGSDGHGSKIVWGKGLERGGGEMDYI